MWLIILGGVLAFLSYFLGVRPFRHWKEKGVPYIKPWPLVGTAGATLTRRKAFATVLQEQYNAYPDKRYVGIYQFIIPALILRDPELIKILIVKEFDTFPQHAAFAPNDVDPLWSKNLFSMTGQKWHDMRSTLSPAFTASKMRMMFDLMKECSKQFTKHFQKQGGTVTMEMKDAFTRFTNDVIATTAFGINCDSLENQDNEFYLMGREATDFTGIKALKFGIGILSPTLMKLLKIGIFNQKVSAFFRKVIKETLTVREEKGVVRPDMVHLLMEARKDRLKTGEVSNEEADSGFAVAHESNIGKGVQQKAKITDDDITAQALVFFVAGFDTVSTLMCFTAYELAVNSDIQETLRKEVDQALEDCKGDFTYDGLQGMKYLDMVVTETLRKWPPTLASDRISIRPFTIEPELPGEKPITLDVGASVWVPIYPLHRDPKYYPNPEKFDPERFSDANKGKIKPYTYLPFGTGPRNCIGSRFALLEAKLVIAEILTKFEIVPVAKTQIPLQLSKASMVAAAEQGFWLGLKPRNKD